MDKLLQELKDYMQEMIDELNESSDDPELDPDCDFSMGYIAGMGLVIKQVEELLNA